MNARSVLLALAAGIVLADTSIVTLALPDLQRDLHTSVEGVAAVLFTYTAVLAGVLALAGTLWRRRPSTAGAAGFLAAAAGSVLCAVAGSLGVLLAGRALQALGGAAGLLAAFELMDGAARGRRLWLGAAVVGVAVGPALGGALTDAFGWRAIFVFQAPAAVLAALACLRAPLPAAAPATEAPPPPAPRARASVALALVSAALSAVLFLLVLLVVAGWNVSPLRAAVTVSVLPLAAIAGAIVRGDPWRRAALGCALVGAGVLALAWLPEAHLTWTLAPQALAGFGMGLALPALGGELLPERNPREAARVLAIRHAGIAVLLAAIAPVISHELRTSTETAKLHGIALVLDARLPPQEKLGLAPSLLSAADRDQPRASLLVAFAADRSRFHGPELAAFDEVGHRADDTLLEAIRSAFLSAFLITGGLALLAALVLLAGGRAPPRARRVALAGVLALAAGVAVPVGYALAQRSLRPASVAIADPCHRRPLPSVGGATGLLQDRVLQALDLSACRLHATREELVLALADSGEARRFKQAHNGVDPRSASSLLLGLLGGG